MPKDTFFNLEEKKRNRIIKAAIDEFSENSFEISSINQIVKNSNIAKGSFYQYFQNKEDIYKLIIDLCSEKKKEYVMKVLNRSEYMNFYDKLSETYTAMMTFSEDNPKLSNILNHLYRIDDIDFRNDMIKYTESNTIGIFEKMVELGQKEGKIKKSFEPEFLAMFLYNAGMFLTEYREGKGILYDIEDGVNDLMNILNSGIKPSQKNKGLMNLI